LVLAAASTAAPHRADLAPFSPGWRLAKPYLCEGCRLTIEEVDFQLQDEISRRQKRGDKPGAINPAGVLKWVCNFSAKQPARFRRRMAHLPEAYKRHCAEIMADGARRQALIDTIAGKRAPPGSATTAASVAQARQLCVNRLHLCPAARYREPVDACDACLKVMADMDDMLSRTPFANMTEGLAAEHIEFQCETLPHRFVGAQRPTNLLESTCQEITEGADDTIILAAMKHPAERRQALLDICASRCKDRKMAAGKGGKKKKNKNKNKNTRTRRSRRRTRTRTIQNKNKKHFSEK